MGDDEPAMKAVSAYAPKYLLLAFSEVNPDNVSVYAQKHTSGAPRCNPVCVPKTIVFGTVSLTQVIHQVA
jgi:hypothetical protein